MQLYKVVVTVPESHGELLRRVIGDANGGKVGNYTHCSFTVTGIGRFTPQSGSQPAIGSLGKAEEVVEERIEINCDENSLQPVIKAIRDNHPYEEPIIDIYPLLAQ